MFPPRPYYITPDVGSRRALAREQSFSWYELRITERELTTLLAHVGTVFSDLLLAEQARILRLLIERIDVAPDGISVMLHAAGIRSLVAEIVDQETSAPANSKLMLKAAES